VGRLKSFFAVWRRRRWRIALAVALASDALSFGLEAFSLGLAEPLQIAVDAATALLVSLLIGFRWSLAIPLAIEAVPGLAVFPTWAAALAALAALEPPEASADPAKP
jgi:hypothetical protein